MTRTKSHEKKPITLFLATQYLGRLELTLASLLVKFAYQYIAQWVHIYISCIRPK